MIIVYSKVLVLHKKKLTSERLENWVMQLNIFVRDHDTCNLKEMV